MSLGEFWAQQGVEESRPTPAGGGTLSMESSKGSRPKLASRSLSTFPCPRNPDACPHVLGRGLQPVPASAGTCLRRTLCPKACGSGPAPCSMGLRTWSSTCPRDSPHGCPQGPVGDTEVPLPSSAGADLGGSAGCMADLASGTPALPLGGSATGPTDRKGPDLTPDVEVPKSRRNRQQ